ncbi:MAG TPA: hypothetical protein VHA52_01365 [Candidatus Babeliaceae bacterium]|nr:hypothetical protein [Candidatus Babeliaceae bacterium]
MPKALSIILLMFLIPSIKCFSQNAKQAYTTAFSEQLRMLEGKQTTSFKRAVFLTENAYYGNTLNYNSFCSQIRSIAVTLQQMIRGRNLSAYKTAPNWAAFSFMTDTIPANNFKPFTYDFDDFTGSKDWSKMFVTKLLKTHSGNCHSLPYLYKIICEEIGGTAYLAFAPNHCYIKHIGENGQWTNVELTNPSFPSDQDIVKQDYVTVEEIRQNIYMAPLTQKQSIASAMRDLAEGYKAKIGYDNFYMTIVNTALKYYPKCIPLIQDKANCLLTMIKAEQKKSHPDTAILFADIRAHKQTMKTINALGYKDMPLELYKEWVKSVEREKQRRAALSKNTSNKKI